MGNIKVGYYSQILHRFYIDTSYILHDSYNITLGKVIGLWKGLDLRSWVYLKSLFNINE